MKSYKYILLDWDGCLAMTLDVWLDAYKKIFAEYNLYPENKVITQEVFGDWNGPVKVGISNIEEYKQKLIKKVYEKYSEVPLYPGVPSVLKEMKKRQKKLALITSSKRSAIQEALEYHDFSHMFDAVLTAEDVAKHKPDPEIVFKAIAKIGGTKDEAIIIGDSKSDLCAAQNAGIDSILYYPSHNEAFYDIEDLLVFHPTYQVSDFQKVLDIVT